MVDLPYDFASETCRMRCQILLRRKMAVTIAQLYEFPDEDLPDLVKKGLYGNVNFFLYGRDSSYSEISNRVEIFRYYSFFAF